MIFLVAVYLIAQCTCVVALLDPHAYFRPTSPSVSGFPGNSAPYHRSPCPGLNTLANHGYLPRNGKNITPLQLKKVLMDVFHVSEQIGNVTTAKLPPLFSLADLSIHGLIEHDASLVHEDSFFNRDPSRVNDRQVDKLLALGSSKVPPLLNKKDIASFRANREKQCALNNPKYSLPPDTTAYTEAAILILIMGDYSSQTISVANADAFLRNETFPLGWKRPTLEISLPSVFQLTQEIQILEKQSLKLASDF